MSFPASSLDIEDGHNNLPFVFSDRINFANFRLGF